MSKRKLIQGDCSVVMKKIPDGCIDLIVTDPPYDITINGGGTVNTIKKLNKSLNEGIGKANITKGFNYDYIFSEWDRVLKNINIYTFCKQKFLQNFLS